MQKPFISEGDMNRTDLAPLTVLGLCGRCFEADALQNPASGRGTQLTLICSGAAEQAHEHQVN